MMKKSYVIVFCTLSVLLLYGASTHAQQSKTLTENSYAHARQILERGVQALGGLKNFQAVEDIAYKSSAQVPEIGQSANPEAAYFSRPLDTEGIIDLRGKRNYQLSKTHFLGSGLRSSSTVTTDKSGFTVDVRANAVYAFEAPAIAANNRRVQRIFPHLLLQLALNRAASLRWLGEENYDGRKQQIIAFTDTDASLFTLYFDAQADLLTKVETLTDNVLKGLCASETIFSDYRPVSGVQMPFHVVSKVGGEVTSDLTYNEIKFNTHPDAALFEIPKGAEAGPAIGGAPQPVTLTKLAKDVYFVNAISTNGVFFYSSMFVVFKDYVLVVEAPLNDATSQSIIAKIKETVPGKPIKYLVPTHYHIDHTGGARSYIAEGSTVVTTPGNRNFFEKLARVSHPLNPDRLSLQPRQPSVETFKEKRVFNDGEQVVELYNVGPTQHADEILIIYLPQHKLAFVSDLFLTNFNGRIGPAEPLNVFFYEKIQQLGLQIETIAAGHGRISTMKELKQSIAEKDSTSNGR